jgi:hypothetical protein
MNDRMEAIGMIANLHPDNVPVLLLTNKLDENTEITDCALCIGYAHDAVHAAITSDCQRVALEA